MHRAKDYALGFRGESLEFKMKNDGPRTSETKVCGAVIGV